MGEMDLSRGGQTIKQKKLNVNSNDNSSNTMKNF